MLSGLTPNRQKWPFREFQIREDGLTICWVTENRGVRTGIALGCAVDLPNGQSPHALIQRHSRRLRCAPARHQSPPLGGRATMTQGIPCEPGGGSDQRMDCR